MKFKELYYSAVFLFLLFVVPGHLFAEENETESSGSSLVVGTMPLYFHYNNQTWYNELAYFVMLGSPKSHLLLAYGESGDLYLDHLRQNQAYNTRFLHLNMQLGGDATLWSRFLRLPLHIYVPIRFNSGYHRLMFDGQSPDMAGQDPERDTKNFLNLTLGAGLGASYRLTLLDRIPIIGSDFSFDAHFLRSPGMMIRFISDETVGGRRTENDNEVGAAVSNEFLLMARMHRFLEANIGVTIGMRHSSTNWSTGPFEFSELVSAVTGEEVPSNEMSYSGFFIGINW